MIVGLVVLGGHVAGCWSDIWVLVCQSLVVDQTFCGRWSVLPVVGCRSDHRWVMVITCWSTSLILVRSLGGCISVWVVVVGCMSDHRVVVCLSEGSGSSSGGRLSVAAASGCPWGLWVLLRGAGCSSLMLLC